MGRVWVLAQDGMALLAPEIQEAILLSGGNSGRHQGVLPMLCRAMPWERQRALWSLSYADRAG